MFLVAWAAVALSAATPVYHWQAQLVVNRAVSAEGRPLAAADKSIHCFSPLSGSNALSVKGG
jgi:hypothetical protein